MSSKYKFEYIDPSGNKVTHEFSEPGADYLIDQFIYFLRGVSFHDVTIRNAFESKVEEWKYADEERTSSGTDF